MKTSYLMTLAARFSIGAVTILSLLGCQVQEGNLSGETMGTSYHIRYRGQVDAHALQREVEARLDDINQSMSTYDAHSTISRFNVMESGSIEIDADFVRVLKDAWTVHDRAPAFDPTVLPLVELWGFGSSWTLDQLITTPSDADIEAAKARMGFDSIRLDGRTLTKTRNVSLDFSAIAKGYGVDVIAQTLQRQGIENYLVEIGGEVATQGQNTHNKPWTLGINNPLDETQAIARIHQLPDAPLHLATSGTYRNHLTLDGVSYAHTIDPTTGRPTQMPAASVSVIADSTSLADAWATALSAMNVDKALDLARRERISALFVRVENDTPTLITTGNMDVYISHAESDK